MNKKVIISLLLVIIWMVIIFLLSNLNSTDSNNKSVKVVSTIVNKYDEITNQNNDVKLKHQSNTFLDNANLLVRKLSHSIEYLILAIFVCNFIFVLKKYKYLYLISFIICLVYASFDEYHQTFVIGRSGNIIDVLIDSVGVLFGLIIFYLIRKKLTNEKKN